MDDTLKEDLEAFKLAKEAEQDQRTRMLDVLRFVKEGKQWEDQDIRQRQIEGRPCLTINRLPAFGKQVLNDARQNRPAIKCLPVGDKADKETAEILNGLIRNIEYTSNADIAYDTALDFAVHCGVGYATVDIDYATSDSFEKDIRIKRISNVFSVYGDPKSTEADSNDWNDAFITDRLTEKEFKARWPDASLANFEQDDSRDEDWFEEERIQIAERWSRELVKAKLLKLEDGALMMEAEYLKLRDVFEARGIGVAGDRITKIHKVTQRIISGAEVLETNPWHGIYIPIVPCYGDECNIEGKRRWQGLFEFAIDAQKNYNYWRTAATEQVALSPKIPYVGRKGAFDTDADKWATANTKNHAFIEYDGPEKPERQPFAGVPAGMLQESLNSSDDLKNIIGLHDASLGAQGNETSGRAIIARQREGDTATFNFIDNQRRFIAHIGRILVDLIPKVYDVPRIVRVIKEDGTNYSVPVNQPVMQARPQEGPPEPGQPPQWQPVPPEMQEHQDELAGLTKVFDLKAGKYDVTCETGPSFSTRREEASTQMAEFIRSVPNVPPKALGILVKNLDWPGADDFAKAISGEGDPQLQQAQQAIQQLQQQLQQATQQVQDKQAEIQLKAKELQIKEMDAQTKFMQVQQQANQPGEAPVDNSFEQWKTEMQLGFERWKTEQDNAVKLTIAAQSHEATMSGQAQAIEGKANERVQGELGPVLQQLAGEIGTVKRYMQAPRKLVRGPDGRASHSIVEIEDQE